MILNKTVFIKKPTGLYHKYYKDLGYDVSLSIIEIDIKHLSHGSKTKVDVVCQYCFSEKKLSYCDYIRTTKNGTLYSCKDCGSKKQKDILLQKTGFENSFQIPEVKLKIKKTCLDKYGVDNFTKTDSFKESYKKTCLDKYGVSNYSKTNEYKEKSKKTCLEKYGVDNFTKTDDYKNKSKQTCLDKYGVDSYSKSEEFWIKYKMSCLSRYGVEYHTQNCDWKNKICDINRNRYGTKVLSLAEDFRKKHFKISNHENYIQYLGDRISFFKCINGHNFEIHYDNYKSRTEKDLPLCTICYPINTNCSIKEKELYEFIKSIYNGEVIQSYGDRLEIDIFLPELKIGFEFNGLYWHSEIYKDKNYHLDKTNYFKEKNIKIIHIWEDDWIFKNEIIKSQIRNLLNLSYKIHGRKCEVKEISNISLVRDFLNNNHLQGWVNSKVKIGLFYENDLVSIVTFDKSEGRKRMSEGEWNLSRFCNKTNILVVGAASKLLKFFILNYKPKRIISYADKNWSTGDLYLKLGFILKYESNPDYKYFIENKRYHKSNFKKSLTNVSESNLNIPKIWDCGKIKFEKITDSE